MTWLVVVLSLVGIAVVLWRRSRGRPPSIGKKSERVFSVEAPAGRMRGRKGERL